MSHPWDYEETVRIDADDILDYVRENKEWFLEQLDIQKSSSTIKEEIKDLSGYVDSIIDKYNKVRIVRDSSVHNQDELSVKMYEDLIAIKKSIEQI